MWVNNKQPQQLTKEARIEPPIQELKRRSTVCALAMTFSRMLCVVRENDKNSLKNDIIFLEIGLLKGSQLYSGFGVDVTTLVDIPVAQLMIFPSWFAREAV